MRRPILQHLPLILCAFVTPVFYSSNVLALSLRNTLINEGYLSYRHYGPTLFNGEERTGWTDVRHPSLAGPDDVVNGYDRSDRFVNVRSTILQDANVLNNAGTIILQPAVLAPSNGRINDFDFANKAWAQAGLSIIEADVRPINSPRILIGDLNTPNQPAGSFKFPLSNWEELTIMSTNNATATGTVDLYYTGGLDSGALGETYPPSLIAGAMNEGIFMNNNQTLGPGNTTIADVFAHELGHFLLDNQAGYRPISTEPWHSDDRYNLMAPGAPVPANAMNGRWGPGLPMGFNSAPWDIAASINVVGRPMSTNLDGSPKVGGTNQIEISQIQTVFSDLDVAPWLNIPNDNGFTHGDRADFDWVEDNIILELAGGKADNHPGFDFLTWEIANIAASSHPNPDHKHDNWGELNLGRFNGNTFQIVDVISQIARYADMDVDASGDRSAKESALDYTIEFSSDSINWVRGTLNSVFEDGWTLASKAEDYVARWFTDIAAKFVRIAAKPLGGNHDGNTQIDALIAGTAKDFGDAPDSYKTLLASDGPRYDEGVLQRLGAQWDSEIDGQPTRFATGDDMSILGGFPVAVDDEDGVIFGDSWVDVIFNIARAGVSDYQLRGWWDTNSNGIFDHSSELYIDDLLSLSPGVSIKRYNLSFNPSDYYTRFRLTWDPLDLDVKPFGEFYSKSDCNSANAASGNCISHGEVEDYAPVPGPLPILGVGAAFNFARRLRRLSKSQKADKLYA